MELSRTPLAWLAFSHFALHVVDFFFDSQPVLPPGVSHDYLSGSAICGGVYYAVWTDINNGNGGIDAIHISSGNYTSKRAVAGENTDIIYHTIFCDPNDETKLIAVRSEPVPNRNAEFSVHSVNYWTPGAVLDDTLIAQFGEDPTSTPGELIQTRNRFNRVVQESAPRLKSKILFCVHNAYESIEPTRCRPRPRHTNTQKVTQSSRHYRCDMLHLQTGGSDGLFGYDPSKNQVWGAFALKKELGGSGTIITVDVSANGNAAVTSYDLPVDQNGCVISIRWTSSWLFL